MSPTTQISNSSTQKRIVDVTTLMQPHLCSLRERFEKSVLLPMIGPTVASEPAWATTLPRTILVCAGKRPGVSYLRASQLVNLQMRIVVRWVSSHRAIADRGSGEGVAWRASGGPVAALPAPSVVNEETTEPLDYLGSGVFRLSEKCSLFHETSLWEQESGR